MHRLNIFQSYHGHSGWVGLFFRPFSRLTLTLSQYAFYLFYSLLNSSCDKQIYGAQLGLSAIASQSSRTTPIPWIRLQDKFQEELKHEPSCCRMDSIQPQLGCSQSTRSRL
jgi:hypothetical protein